MKAMHTSLVMRDSFRMRHTGTTFECWIWLQPRMSTYFTSSLGSDRSEEKVNILVSY
jgi:hypothetical protein